MRIVCPGPGEVVKLFSWCEYGPRTFSVNVMPVLPAVASMRDSDGFAPHLIYTSASNGNDGYTQISGATGFDKRFDTKLIVEFDCGTHMFQRPGSLELTGGEPGIEIDVSALDEHRAATPANPYWHNLTRLVLGTETVTIPRWHTRIGAWTPRPVTLEGQPLTPSAVPVACIPGTELANPAGANIMVFTQWWG